MSYDVLIYIGGESVENSDVEELYLQHGKMIFGYLLRKTCNPLVAEELTQETFYQAFISIHRYRGECKATTWLCQIANHVWFNYLKKEKYYDYKSQVINCEKMKMDLIDFIIEKNEKNLAYRALLKIPTEMREVVYLKITGDFTFAEIGKILGKSEAWARTNFYRGKQKMIKEVHSYEN